MQLGTDGPVRLPSTSEPHERSFAPNLQSCGYASRLTIAICHGTKLLMQSKIRGYTKAMQMNVLWRDATAEPFGTIMAHDNEENREPFEKLPSILAGGAPLWLPAPTRNGRTNRSHAVERGPAGEMRPTGLSAPAVRFPNFKKKWCTPPPRRSNMRRARAPIARPVSQQPVRTPPAISGNVDAQAPDHRQSVLTEHKFPDECADCCSNKRSKPEQPKLVQCRRVGKKGNPCRPRRIYRSVGHRNRDKMD